MSTTQLPNLARDFHELTSAEVAIVLEHADSAKYRKPKNANGSRGRYFWQKLQREDKKARK